MKRTILALATLVALGTTGAFAFGSSQCQGGMQGGMMSPMMQQGGGMMMHGGERGMMAGMMFDRLDLSDDQRYKLNVLRSEMRLEMAKLHDPKSMQKMQELMSADTFDKKAFIKLRNEMNDERVTLEADFLEKAFSILTKDQRAELKKIMSERPQRPMMPKVSEAPQK